MSNAKSLEDIQRIYSHSQVWGQVTKFLSQNIDEKITKIDTDSTSRAAELAINDESGTSACISSKISADLYKLPILFENVENIENNTTRFLILGYNKIPYNIPTPKDVIEQPISYITSLIFTLNHDDPGALCVALDSFRKFNVNLTSINSRPSHLKQWQYVFFVELNGSTDDVNVSNSISRLSNNCLELVVLGSFERCWRYWGQ